MSTSEANRYAFPASAIASGTLADARIPDLATSKITSGTFADARFASSNITQHVDLTNLNASNLTSGTVPDARVSASSVTAHVTAVTQTTGSWTPSFSGVSVGDVTGRYARTGNIVMCVATWRYTSRAAHTNTNDWVMSGLPITAANVGNTAGGGMWTGYARGKHPILKIGPNTTTVKFFTYAAKMDQTDTYHNHGNFGMFNQDGSNHGGLKVLVRDSHDSTNTTMYGHCLLTYQV